MKKYTRWALATVAFTVVFHAAIALAQDTFSDLEQAIQRNEELLHEARILVRQTASAKARTSLETAEQLHRLSKELAAAGDRPLMAARATLRARQAILNTINLAKREARLEENAQRAMERAAVRLQHARTLYEEYGSRDDVPVRKLIEEAYEQLQRARNNMREHLYDVALRLATASIEMSNRAIQMMKQDSIRPEDVFRELDRTDQILERLEARDGAATAPNAERAVETAHDLQNRARRNARNDAYRLAIEQTRRARDIALRLLRGAGAVGAPDRDNVARAISFTDELLDHARSVAVEEQLSQLAERLDDATRLQSEARMKFEGDQYRAAMALTLRARDTVKRALRSADRALDPGTVADVLEKTDALLRRASERARQENDGNAAALIERARARQDEARGAFDDGELRRALALTRVARSLATQALEVLTGDER